MQHLPAPIHHARDAAQLPVAIDYPAALALRQMSMVHDELPKYLLAPEVVSARPTTSRICAARCCWPHCGTPVHALMKHWR
ncbi:hypothetical protein ACLB1O_30690 [Escherichia coli]